MTDVADGPVRRWLTIREALRVLAAEGPLQRKDVLARVGESLADEFTAYEKATLRNDDDTPRWAINLSWGSTDMAAAMAE